MAPFNKINQIDRSGKKTILYGARKCIHKVLKRKDDVLNKNENKTGKAKEPGKNTNCPAELSFSIVVQPPSTTFLHRSEALLSANG